MADFPEAAHDLLLIDHLLSEEERATRHAVRAFAVSRLGRTTPAWSDVLDATVTSQFDAWSLSSDIYMRVCRARGPPDAGGPDMVSPAAPLVVHAIISLR